MNAWHPRRSWLLGAALLLFGTCCARRDPTGPRPSPPSTAAIPPYWEPLWMPDGVHIGLNHRPLRSVSYDPTTGNVRYQWVDSLAGWWVVRTDGTDLHRHFAAYLDEPAVRARN